MKRPPYARVHVHSRAGRAGLIALAIAAVALTVLFLRGRGEAPETPAEIPLEDRYVADKRIRPLLEPCGFGNAFEADTSDLVRVLATKLDAQAQREPMRRATAVLAEMGNRAEAHMTRLFEDALRDRMRVPVAKNVLGVAANSTGDYGPRLARIGLSSQSESIRRESAIVLMRHPSPEAYDELLGALPALQQQGTFEHALKALYLASPKRFVEQLGQWLQDAAPEPGERAISPRIEQGAALVARVDDPELAEILRTYVDAYPWLNVRQRLHMLVAPARFGDEEALRSIKDELASPRQRQRLRAAEALAMAGLGREIYVLTTTSEDPTETATAWTLMLEPEALGDLTEAEEDEVFGWARAALSDPSDLVRRAVLGPLLTRGDERARALLIQTLTEGTAFDRTEATKIMRDTFGDDAEFAGRIRTILAQLWEAQLASGAPALEFRSIITALGAVPGTETGRYLWERAKEIQSLNARLVEGKEAPMEPRDAIAQMFNAGPESRDVILEALGTETDPFLRLDLIYHAWQDFDSDSFEVLAGILEDETKSKYERLYAADRLLRMKDPERLLPILKRVYRSAQEPVLHNGLHCMLWIWFGPPMQ